jgi:hypothetical protein
VFFVAVCPLPVVPIWLWVGLQRSRNWSLLHNVSTFDFLAKEKDYRLPNSLLRQYAPKNRSLNTVDEDEIKIIQNRLNNKSSKIQGLKIAPNGVHSIIKVRCASSLYPPSN